MNSAAYNSERITYHQISMYEYEFCTSTAINQNIDRINRLSWKFITIFAIKLYCSSILMQGIKKTKKCFKQFNHSKLPFLQGRYHLSLGRVKVFFSSGSITFLRPSLVCTWWMGGWVVARQPPRPIRLKPCPRC